jgi:NAD(P) transhydrogenase subunit alpha
VISFARHPPQVKSLGAKFVDTGVSAEGTRGYARELTDEEKRK